MVNHLYMHPSTRIQEGFKFGGGGFAKNQDFSFWGENAVKPGDSGYKPRYSGFLNTPGETPGISPDTPGLGYSGENSGYRPGNSGLGGPDTPGISLDTPDFWGLLWARECKFCVNYLWLHLAIGCFKICNPCKHSHIIMHTCSSRGGGGRIRGGCGATGASPTAGGSRGAGPRPG